MRKIHVSICEQTHAECQGFCCDDHIDKACYTLLATEEETAQLRAVHQEIDRLYQADLDDRLEEWHKNNPDEDECCCEGDEFIGCRWTDWSDYDATTLNDYTSAEPQEMLQILTDLLADLKEQYDDEPEADEPHIVGN